MYIFLNCLFCANDYGRHFEEHGELENPIFDLKEFVALEELSNKK